MALEPLFQYSRGYHTEVQPGMVQQPIVKNNFSRRDPVVGSRRSLLVSEESRRKNQSVVESVFSTVQADCNALYYVCSNGVCVGALARADEIVIICQRQCKNEFSKSICRGLSLCGIARAAEQKSPPRRKLLPTGCQ